MLLVATSALLGAYLTEIQAPQALARSVSELTSNKWVVLALLNVLFLVLGMFLHSAAAIILVVPVVMPLVKAVGVANFTTPLLLDLFSYARIQPAVNQIELHPYLQQTRLVEFCQRLGLVVTAYSPLARPGYEEMSARLVDEKVIREIASAHGKTPAQVLLRWGIQRNTVVIPKSSHPKRIQENIAVFDFELSESDMRAIAGLERGLRIVDPYQWGQIPYFD